MDLAFIKEFFHRTKEHMDVCWMVLHTVGFRAGTPLFKKAICFIPYQAQRMKQLHTLKFGIRKENKSIIT